MDEVFSLNDYEDLARPHLSDEAYAYISGGAADEVTMADNPDAFRAWRLRPRVLTDVSKVDPSATMLGTPVSIPVALAPVAQQRFAHPHGEVASATGAAEGGTVFCLSTLASCSIEEVAETDASRWFQLYVHPDRKVSEDLMRRAAAAGYGAIVLTVDLPVAGWRERELRGRVGLHVDDLGNLRDLAGGEEGLRTLVEFLIDKAVGWDDIAWAKEVSGLPVVVKGVLTGEDARLVAENGGDAIVVSNHGGRQLDRVPATIEVLEECAEAAAGRVEVYLDGGVRRGTDVLIALALGADAVLIGRPYVYALAAAGATGVAQALRVMREEIENAMALLGVRTVDEVTRAHVV
jgi:isopentenyl diphosphate isomerase/L-lactate dehydrogenase-like FMN-dependent dehydrogenase